MPRSTYFYCLAPALTLLSCLPNTMSVLTPPLWMGLSCVLMLIVWGLVWVRLYQSKHLRPEFSLLPVLPYALFLYFMGLGKPLLSSMQSPTWGNFYFILWLIAAIVAAISLKQTVEEKKASEGTDTAGIMMRVSCFLFAAFAWAACASILFPPPIH